MMSSTPQNALPLMERLRIYWKRLDVWARENLFNTPLNSILTVVMGVVAVLFLFYVIRFVLVDANWEDAITANLRTLILGTYPDGAEVRLWIPLAMLMTILGTAFGMWANVRTYAIFIGSIAVILLLLGLPGIPSWINALSFGLALPIMTPVIDPETGREMLDAAGMPVLGFSAAWWGMALVLAGSYAVSWIPRIPFRGRTMRSFSGNPISLQMILLAVALTILVAVLLQFGVLPGQDGTAVFPSQWGGIFIDILVFSVGGGFIMFPLGLLLALARTSRFPVLSYSASVYIEIIRAGPLVVWLIFAFFLWDEFLVVTPEFPIRAMLVFGFFGAAYIAEVVRGGMQSIPKGQYEAAFSLNLTTATTYTRIILPQAIRAVIPAIIGRFISIWKDTSLLAALGVINLISAGRAIINSDFANFAFQFEIYLAIAIVYWMVSYAFSRFGRHTEKQLNL